MKLNGFKKAATTTLAGLASLAALGAVVVSGASPAIAAGTARTIHVGSDSDLSKNFSVYADLYDKNGNKVYHWQATSRKRGTSVNWNFTEGDGGWLDLWIDPGTSQRVPNLNISLDQNICYHIYQINGNGLGSYQNVAQCSY